ncbi:MAG: choline kinase, partial [Spirochaetales bacterium]|nr:choline kinase [Spirochaetales bacterium]
MSVEEIVQKCTGAQRIRELETIQSLWSGYGSIIRYQLFGQNTAGQDMAGPAGTVIVKHVRFREGGDHPRGWDTDLSHRRKLHSYQVETAWYRDWSARCSSECRVPVCFGLESSEDDVIMVLEDLDASGFPGRRSSVTDAELQACLSWLAHFHARFLGEHPKGLWETGTYWHLET